MSGRAGKTAFPALARRLGKGEATHAGHLRRLNLERLLSVAIARPGPFTRAELIQATSLSAPTVGSLSSELLREGLLKDLGHGPSQGGRRPSVMEFNAEHGFVVGLVLGPAETRVAVADLRGEPRAQKVFPTPSRSRPQPLLSRLATFVRTTLAEAEVPEASVVTIVAGAPGAVDRSRGTVLTLVSGLEGWEDVPMAEILGRELSATVVVENDVNLAVLGEQWRGAAEGHETCAFVYLGVGIGAGILVDSELHRGRHFMAGEVGLMCMGPQYAGRDFGSRGCFEALAGTEALLQEWRGSRPAGDADLGALFAARGSDLRARRVLKAASTLIGVAVTNLSLVLDPSLVVLGGPLVEGSDPTFLEDIRSLVSRVIPSPPALVASRLGEEAPLWGSLRVAAVEAGEILRQRLGRSAETSPVRRRTSVRRPAKRRSGRHRA